jgi:NADP-dependent 3-hydroxy acid dehydrogenase YdfG
MSPPFDGQPVAVVTGAGSGIGAATANRLAGEGFSVVLAGRRHDRLDTVAKEIHGRGGRASVYPLDVTDRPAVKAFAASLDRCDVLVNNAGGAIGTEQVEEADPADWRTMYETNVLGSLHVTQALLPRLLLADGGGTVVVLSSTAGFTVYEGGGGYSAAKHGQHALAGTLRMELCGRPVRVIEVAPGMVHTEEFSLNRYRGDATRAANVYAGVDRPLLADDVADVIAWAVTRPAHVNVDFLVVRPRAQAAQHKVHRTPAAD